MSQLQEKLKANNFVVTAEITPPKGVDVSKALQTAKLLRPWVDAVNVTDQQSAMMSLGSLSLCHLIGDTGLEPILQMTTRDRNRIALQSDLLSASVLGIENVLCLSGDPVTAGDHPDAKPVFDLDTIALIQTARVLEKGRSLAGKPLDGAPKFFLAAAVSPAVEPIEPQLVSMERKIQAGAQFFQTQAIFDAALFGRFMERAKRFGAPVLAGMVLVKSGNQARFMNEHVYGIKVPDALIKEMDAAEDKKRKCVEISAHLIQELKPFCQGVHIMAIGWEGLIPEILKLSGVRAKPGPA
ncbi:MAG: 5,10-methylenetetrahydrofolate reductase [Dehalococcoidia bacterium]|nr:5,10-methylenetetrahydrofolate reductase [Dehalococcoidia bacterium]